MLCNMGAPPVTIVITEDNITPGGLQLQGHSTSALAGALTGYLGKQETFDDTDLLRPNAESFGGPCGTWNMHAPEDFASMQRAFGIFDAVFFNNLLGRHCDLELAASDSPHGERGKGYSILRHPRSGFARSLLGGSSRIRCDIVVNIDLSYHHLKRFRARSYRDTLLHEMIHAYPLLYGSNTVYHGVDWQQIAHAISSCHRAWARIHKSCHIPIGYRHGPELGPAQNLARDIHVGIYARPSQQELYSFGISAGELNEHLRRWRVDDVIGQQMYHQMSRSQKFS